MVQIPAELLQAIAADGGGRVALVIGAGCSVELPTDIPLAQPLAVEVERQLVRDGVIQAGEFTEPGNLAALTTFIFERTGSQHAVVSRFPLTSLRLAKPNLGYRLLVALMAERAISHVLSLNFDLAVQNAATDLGARIEVVDRPGVPIPATATLVHLHGNANNNSEALVLREETLDEAWRGQWHQIVAQQILSAPNVLFVGLGSPAPVLSEGVAMISEALGGAKTTFQADLADHDANALAQQLNIPQERYIKGGWSAVLDRLGRRVAEDQVHAISVAGLKLLNENGADQQDVAAFAGLVSKCTALSLLALGKLRAFLRLDAKSAYKPASTNDHELMVEPMSKLGELCEHLGLDAHPTPAGAWKLERDGKLVASALLATGGGVRRLAALESKALHLCECIAEASTSAPDFVLIGGATLDAPSLAHVDIIADKQPEDLIDGPKQSAIWAASDPDLIAKAELLLNAS